MLESFGAERRTFCWQRQFGSPSLTNPIQSFKLSCNNRVDYSGDTHTHTHTLLKKQVPNYSYEIAQKCGEI